MILEERIVAFEQIGDIFLNFKDDTSFEAIFSQAQLENSWFVASSIEYALLSLGHMLEPTKLRNWIGRYQMNNKIKKIGVINSSNIPLVGFYDFFCVLLSGNVYVGKLSSSNQVLLPFVATLLCKINPKFKNRIFFQENLSNTDLIIATGNDNTADHFRYMFKNQHKIIRNNRNSVAVIEGCESMEDYIKLSQDIFMYFGLGCRSVSKIFLPESFKVKNIRSLIQYDHEFTSNQFYMDNYYYQKALLITNNTPFHNLDNLLLVESPLFNSPISVLYYEYYQSIDNLSNIIRVNQEKIQCVVSNNFSFKNRVPFGRTQQPSLADAPDGVDVMKFILES